MAPSKFSEQCVAHAVVLDRTDARINEEHQPGGSVLTLFFEQLVVNRSTTVAGRQNVFQNLDQIRSEKRGTFARHFLKTADLRQMGGEAKTSESAAVGVSLLDACGDPRFDVDRDLSRRCADRGEQQGVN